VPAWLWPSVSALALVVGLLGGLAGGAIIAGEQGSQGSGGILHVQRRTAAPLPADNGSIPAVAAKVLPSTVQIVAEYDGNPQGATGSGFVMDKQGHIITNNHVVAEAAADDGPIEIIDHHGRHYSATVVGRSSVYDIAVLEASDARHLRPAAFGSADQMRVGETVVAIGSPLGLSATVTSGIVSAVHRPVTTGNGSDSSFINAVQTDAAINPGNSGGPLVNLQGQVVGVNSAIASLGSSSITSGESGNIGVGFAIPIEQVEVTTDQILKTGQARYPVIGANVRGTRKLDGALIASVEPGQPAARAGLHAGDLVTALDGQPISGSIDLVVAIRSHVPGDTVTLTVRRSGHDERVKVRLASKVG
jgi:putative serine protease PepD